ncbi:MAG: glutathione S-transferase family protein [Pseudomonadota bacterium]
MEKVTLYGIAVSAFVAKVRIALDLKGVTYVEVVPPEGYGSSAYRALVPAGSVPGLVHETAQGPVRLSDSNAIVEYIDEAFAGPALIPAGPPARAETRMLMGFHDTRLEAAARALFPLIKAGGAKAGGARKVDKRSGPEQAALAAGMDGIEAACARLDAILAAAGSEAGTGAGSGATPGLAGSLAYPVTLQMASMMASALGSRLTLPARVADWAAATAALPEVARSLDLARDAMEVWMAGFAHGQR